MNVPDLIKICGLSTTKTIDAAIEGGATHMGFIFFEKSPRYVGLDQAAKLSAYAGNRISKVAVSVNADDAYLDQIVAAVKPDLLQLHGSESINRVAEVKSRHGLPVIKVFSVSSEKDLEQAKPYIGIADHFMFDAKPPKGTNLPGGNGVAFDWEIMDHWPADVPYILSGGLRLDNIIDAIAHSGAMGIDLSSGVESDPGVKDINLIREFLRIATQKDECVE